MIIFPSSIELKNRSRYEVMSAILRSLFKEETRTKIMYKAMLSNDQCKMYLDSLLQSNLVKEVEVDNKVVYRITQNGRKYLSFYSEMQKLLPVGIQEDVSEQYYPLGAR